MTCAIARLDDDSPISFGAIVGLANFTTSNSPAEPALKNTADDFAERPDSRPQTRFEARGARLGHGVWDVIFRKI